MSYTPKYEVSNSIDLVSHFSRAQSTLDSQSHRMQITGTIVRIIPCMFYIDVALNDTNPSKETELKDDIIASLQAPPNPFDRQRRLCLPFVLDRTHHHHNIDITASNQRTNQQSSR